MAKAKDYSRLIERQLDLAERSTCKTCGKRCLNEYNLKLHQKATGHG